MPMQEGRFRCPYCGRNVYRIVKVSKLNRFRWSCERCIQEKGMTLAKK